MAVKKPGSVRIIAGDWRGRRLPVPDLPGLRPSGDRSRETLFNWLQRTLPGNHCIDLFAGTGVLGLEAVSRGAKSAVLVEKSPVAAKNLLASVELLKAQQVAVAQGDALSWLGSRSTDPAARPADLVFVDPPFGLGLAEKTLLILHSSPLLRPGGLVYVETARSESINLPAGAWRVIREKTLGDVRMHLLEKISRIPESN
jgi:16S rRNA (guanine966-N2)-methyltransferase